MGVFHVMGLGTSPGAVTSVLHYLKDRLASPARRTVFFGQSGEWGHRQSPEEQAGRQAGYVQGLVLLTTPELSAGTIRGCYEKDGRTLDGKVVDVVRTELKSLREQLACSASSKIELLTAEIPFRNFDLAFERSLAVVQALHPFGRTGKEVWANLTSGDNTLVLALNTVVVLTGTVGRLYCTNVPKTQEHRLTHPIPRSELGSEKDSFWVDLPYIAVQDNELRSVTLRILEREQVPLNDESVLARIHQEWVSPVALPSIEHFRRLLLHPMEAQKLIERTDKYVIRIGPLGTRLRKYFESASQPTLAESLRKLAEINPEWAKWEEC